MFTQKTLPQKHELTHNEPRKAIKNIILSWGDGKFSMRKMFISGSRYIWNQRFYKQKVQVLQLNSEGHFKKWRILFHKSWSPGFLIC